MVTNGFEWLWLVIIGYGVVTVGFWWLGVVMSGYGGNGW